MFNIIENIPMTLKELVTTINNAERLTDKEADSLMVERILDDMELERQ